MLITLDDIQVETMEYGLKNPYTIIANDMGTGKTACGLAISYKLRVPTLVVCPSYLVTNWQNEIRKTLGDWPIVTAIRKGKDIYDVWDSDFAIISYGLAQKAESLFSWAKLVILDEAHNLKSMTTKRTEFIHRAIFENSVDRLLLLTGTPIKNRVEEYYSLLALCNYDPKIKDSKFLDKFPDSMTFADYFSFRKQYTIQVGNRFIPVVKWVGVKKENELKEYLKGHYIRKVGVSTEEPRIKHVLVSDIENKTLMKEFLKWSDNNSDVNPTAKAEAALQTAPFTVEYARGVIEEMGCVAIYTDHVQSCEFIANSFGVPPITGKMPAQERHRLGAQFQAGESNVIVATVKSFSEGISLTRSSNLIMNDFPWVPGDIDQTIKRIHRRDQTKKCTIHMIHGSPQSEKIFEAVTEKRAVIQKVV